VRTNFSSSTINTNTVQNILQRYGEKKIGLIWPLTCFGQTETSSKRMCKIQRRYYVNFTVKNTVSYRTKSCHNLSKVSKYSKSTKMILYCIFLFNYRSQWLRCPNLSRSAVAWLLRLLVRIPPSAWIFVWSKCYVLLGRGVSYEPIPTDCGKSLCVIQKRRAWGGHGTRWAAASPGKKNFFLVIILQIS
jgi:hypothetical protein